MPRQLSSILVAALLAACDGPDGKDAPDTGDTPPAGTTPTGTTGTPDALPIVAFDAPLAGSFHKAAVGIAVTATDDVGVASVDLLADGQLVATVTSPPYAAVWDAAYVAVGAHTLEAVATDSAGQVSRVSIDVVVDHTPPTVAVDAPAADALVSGGIELSASAADDNGIAEVRFLVDGALVGAATAAPYTVAWDSTTVAYGAHTVDAVAVDVAGNERIASIPVVVDQPPIVALTAPDAGSVVHGLVEIAADAVDDAAVAQVRFLVDGIGIGVDDAAPFTRTWDTCAVASGAHDVEAVATDSAGHTRADVRAVVVDQPLELALPPFTGPVDAIQELTASVAGDQAIVDVVFDVDGAVVASAALPGAGSCDLGCTCAVYAADLDATALPEGPHVLTATATDALGEVAFASTAFDVVYDQDGDGLQGMPWGGEDCDDTSGAVGAPLTWYADGDADGFGDATAPLVACALPADHAADATDCDDADALAHPDAPNGCALGGGSVGAYLPTYVGQTADALQQGHAIDGDFDFDGDGIPDLVVGAPDAFAPAQSSGVARVLLGRPAPLPAVLGPADLAYTGATGFDFAGDDVAGVADFDGDGFDDLLVGAAFAGGGGSPGEVYLVRGGAAPVGGALDAVGVTFSGEDNRDYAGSSVADAGDVNADGYADILIGAIGAENPLVDSGAAYLVFGGPSPASRDLALADAARYGEDGGDIAGETVAGAGDVDGDGFDDVLIGAPWNHALGTFSGAAYLVLGDPTPVSGTLATAIRYTGDKPDEFVGYALAGGGDVDGDGYADMLFGVGSHSTTFRDHGAVYVILGGGALAGGTLEAVASTRIDGAGEDHLGEAVAFAGDVDADGFDDFVASSPYFEANKLWQAGKVELFLGDASASGAVRYAYTGAAAGDAIGAIVAPAGDADGDGFDDFWIHSTTADRGAVDNGVTWLVRGNLR